MSAQGGRGVYPDGFPYIEFIDLKWKRAARLENFLDNKTNLESIISPLSGFAKQTSRSSNHGAA